MSKLFSFHCGRWTLEPSIYTTILFLIILITCSFLSRWQFNRATLKEALLEKIQTAHLENPLFLSDIDQTSFEDIRCRPLHLEGYFENEKSFLLDNQVLNHQAGYKVITPFFSPNHPTLILIDRGWIKKDFTAKSLPSIPSVTDFVHLEGIIHQASTGLILKSIPIKKDPWPKVIQRVDYLEVEEILNKKVYPFLVAVYKAPSSISFAPTPFYSGIPKERHLGYAFQWLALGIISFVYYFLTSIKRVN